MSAAMAAVSSQERRKCLQLLWPLQSLFLLAHTYLPWVQRTVCTVRYSKTVGVTIRINHNWRGQQDTQEVEELGAPQKKRQQDIQR